MARRTLAALAFASVVAGSPSVAASALDLLVLHTCSTPRTAAQVQPRLPDTQGEESSAAASPRVHPDIRTIAVPAQVRAGEARYVLEGSSATLDALAPPGTPAAKGGRPSDRFPGAVTLEPPWPRLSSAAAPESSRLSPSLVASFDSSSIDTNPQLTAPPDPIGAVGPAHVLNVTNIWLRVHAKDGTLATSMALRDFFAPLAPLAGSRIFDPKALYDQHAARFLVVTLEHKDVCVGNSEDRSRILLGVSSTSDPTDPWYLTAIEAGAQLTFFDSNPSVNAVRTHWVDYPGFAVDEDAVYVTANVHTFGTNPANGQCGPRHYGGTRLWIADKGIASGWYAGGTASIQLFDPYGPDTDCFSAPPFCAVAQPAHVFGPTLPPSSPNVGTWLGVYDHICNMAGDEFLQITRVDDPLGAATFTTSYTNVGNVDALGCPGGTAFAGAPQLGSVTTIDANDRRALHAVWRASRLYLTTQVAPGSGADAGQVTAHWFSLTTSATGAIIGIAEQGNVGGEDLGAGTRTFYPSIAVNAANAVAIGFSASGPAIHPTSAYATRLASDPPGTVGASRVLRSGAGKYVRCFANPCSPPGAACNRWGDYSGIAVDPEDECFWIYNEHAGTPGPPTATTGTCLGETQDGRWVTAWGKFCATNCGDGSLDTGEECDDGCAAGIPNVCEAVDDGDGCDSNCTETRCGNGVVTSGEECDDGNLAGCDGCNAACQVEACGGDLDTDDDGVPDCCDICPELANPAQERLVFPEPILAADATSFGWVTPTDVKFVKGTFVGAADVGAYVPAASGSLVGATSLPASELPDPGSGVYYLVRYEGLCGSWQTAPGAEPGRDTLLP